MHQVSVVGGGSYCLLNIVKAIDKRVFEPIVALKDEGPLADELRKLGVEVVIFSQMTVIPYNRGLLQRGSLRAYWAVERSKKSLKQLLVENKIDVLYLNNMMLCRYLQPAKECGCKTVIHVREHWPLDEHKRQLEWARRCVYQYADKLIAINRYSASMFPEKEATIVYDWIDMDSRDGGKSVTDILGEDATNLKVYLYTGGLQPIKGGLEVMTTFTKVIKDENARLLALGVREEPPKSTKLKESIKRGLEMFGWRPYYKKIQEAIKKDHRIISAPYIYDIKRIMEQSYCYLSYFTIPHANLALAECIILKVPCVVANTEESMEYTLNGNLASLFQINDVHDFSKCLRDLNRNYIKKKEILEKNSCIIKEMFDRNKNIHKLLSALNSL